MAAANWFRAATTEPFAGWCATTGNPIETIELDGAETDTIAIAGDGLIFAGNDDGDIILLGAGEV